MTSQTERSVRDELVHAAVALLDEHGPDALQTRKVASAAGTSTMAVYTHFGGMRALIAAVASEGLRQFDAALSVPETDDPVADLLATGMAYRRYAIERPHMYRLMFGSTSAHGINAPVVNILTLTVAEIEQHIPSFAHVVRGGTPVDAGRPDQRWLRGRRRNGGSHRGPVLGADTRVRDARTGRVLRRRTARRSGRCSARCSRIYLSPWEIHPSGCSSRSARRSAQS